MQNTKKKKKSFVHSLCNKHFAVVLFKINIIKVFNIEAVIEGDFSMYAKI